MKARSPRFLGVTAGRCRALRPLVVVALALVAGRALARTLKVGPGEEFANPSQAAAVAEDGDVVMIAPGVYHDVCCWRARNLRLLGAGSALTRIEAGGSSWGGKGAWVLTAPGAVISGIAFAGAKCADRNGAGLRYEGNGPLTLVGCAFEGNENGFLCGRLPQAALKFSGCAFAENGAGDGQSHNLYVGDVARLEFVGCTSRSARGGHLVKSRARETRLVDSLFVDVPGTASYLVDLPNGGRATLAGCTLRQGAQTLNRVMVSAGEEGAYPGSTLALAGCRLYSERTGSQEVRVADGVVRK